ncbi:MAG: phage major capsid protein [Gordonia sp. (in: high G+C Gram-positive bacteria)]|uniref:phage major capsid protein n=1 Tax=Gordonia sp. (in: high G+C Gram-positive bacteria) TaxID=84139 RepID=UPI003C70D53F
MDKWLKQREDLLRSAKSLIDARKSADQALSADDRAHLKSVEDQIGQLDAKIDAVRRDAPLAAQFKSAQSGPVTPGSQGDGSHYDDLSDFAAKSINPAVTAKGLARQYVKAAKTGEATGEKAFSLAGGTSDLVVELATLPQRPTSILQVIPQRLLEAPPTFKYLQQQVRATSAAPVAPGAAKPVSTMGLVPQSGELRVIAHLSEAVDKYLLADVSELGAFIQAEMQYGLFTALEDQVVNGSGTAPALQGLLGTSGVLTQTFGTDLLGTLRSAITKVESAGYVPASFVLSPTDWEKVETTVTAGSGEYLFASSPVDRAARTVWGVPVVTSTTTPAGKAVLLSQDTCWLATDGKVALDLDTSKGFSTNEVTMRVEGRWDLAVTRPSGIVAIDTAASGG